MKPRPPVLLDPAVDDPAAVWALVERHAPYWPVQRYFANSAEYAALSGSAPQAMVVAPVFRGNWATEIDPPLAGVEPLLEHPPFVAAARKVFDAEIVRPHTVYVNLTHQLPFPQGAGHTDVPAFRGFDRKDWPIAFLTIMGLSGLFEDVRVQVATAVAWFYRGADGGFEYWPEGPDGPSTVHEGAIDNTAIVADNDFMWHRVRPTGRPEDGMATLTLDSELAWGPQGWTIDGAGGPGLTDPSAFGPFASDRLRVSLSWKATVFASDADRRRHDEHTDDIDLDGVIGRFRADLRARGLDVDIPADPTRDPDFVRLLQGIYVRYPAAAA